MEHVCLHKSFAQMDKFGIQLFMHVNALPILSLTMQDVMRFQSASVAKFLIHWMDSVIALWVLSNTSKNVLNLNVDKASFIMGYAVKS